MHSYMGLNSQQVYDGVIKYGPAQGASKIINWEYDHAIEAIQTKQYVTYWCQKKQLECGRIGSNSKCFCGHLYFNHNKDAFGKKLKTECRECECKVYRFIPSRPEECGMYWLPRRKDFNIMKWRAKCKCDHNHEDHQVNNPLRCRMCSCQQFMSDFECISCDCLWEEHQVMYETENERKVLRKPIQQAFLPLHSNQDIQQVVFKDKLQQDQQIIFQANIAKIQNNMAKIKSQRTQSQLNKKNNTTHFNPQNNQLNTNKPINKK